jgi:hypothetical protein
MYIKYFKQQPISQSYKPTFSPESDINTQNKTQKKTYRLLPGEHMVVFEVISLDPDAGMVEGAVDILNNIKGSSRQKVDKKKKKGTYK